MNTYHHIDLAYGRPALRLIRRHERCSKKHACYANHLTFLVRCVKNNVIPKDLRIKSPVPTKGARRAAELVARRFLRERIRLTHRARDSNMREINATASQIRTTLSAEDSCKILTKINDTAQATHESCKSRQQSKFLQLMEEKQPVTIESNQVDKTNWVLNLSSRSLTDAETNLLKKGLNFAITASRVPAAEIIAKVESAIRTLDVETADSMRRSVNNILQKAEPPKTNITREMRTALKSLKEDRSVMILPANKGRASVLLDADNYRSKMTSLIETGLYKTVNKDPTDRLCRFTDKLLVLKRNGILDEKTYRKLRPQHKQSPRIYGLPKIHKPNIPLRPIVSCVNSFAYDLSAHLSDLWSPLTGLTSHTVANSTSFVQEISSLSIHADETMVSFDVVSLFTNVPIEGALNAALQRLSADTSLPARTSLSPSQVTGLLGFVLRATYFSYNGSFYEQQEGAAMGSPVSVVIANLYMEVFEEQALQSCDPQLRPRVWKRCVDDTFVISTRASVDGLQAHLNNQQPTIRFTMEAEKDGKIALPDTLVHRESDGRLTTTVYRKATHNDQYLSYDSHHP